MGRFVRKDKRDWPRASEFPGSWSPDSPQGYFTGCAFQHTDKENGKGRGDHGEPWYVLGGHVPFRGGVGGGVQPVC